jgi:hypothetical protein
MIHFISWLSKKSEIKKLTYQQPIPESIPTGSTMNHPPVLINKRDCSEVIIGNEFISVMTLAKIKGK